MIPATFTPASLLYPCEHKGCGRVNTPMRCAWIPYEPTPPGMQARRACWHLCPRHADEWERDGVPAFALEWHRDHGADARALLGEARPARPTTETKVVATMNKPLDLFA